MSSPSESPRTQRPRQPLSKSPPPRRGGRQPSPRSRITRAYSDVPFNKHPRFQELLAPAQQRSRSDAVRYNNVQNFLDTQGLSAEEAADMLVIGGLMKVNPLEAWKRMQPTLKQAGSSPQARCFPTISRVWCTSMDRCPQTPPWRSAAHAPPPRPSRYQRSVRPAAGRKAHAVSDKTLAPRECSPIAGKTIAAAVIRTSTPSCQHILKEVELVAVAGGRPGGAPEGPGPAAPCL
jgi:hypothetical protein